MEGLGSQTNRSSHLSQKHTGLGISAFDGIDHEKDGIEKA